MILMSLCFFGRIGPRAKEGVSHGSRNQVTAGMFRPATLGGYAVPWAYHVNKKRKKDGNLNETNI